MTIFLIMLPENTQLNQFSLSRMLQFAPSFFVKIPSFFVKIRSGHIKHSDCEIREKTLFPARGSTSLILTGNGCFCYSYVGTSKRNSIVHLPFCANSSNLFALTSIT